MNTRIAISIVLFKNDPAQIKRVLESIFAKSAPDATSSTLEMRVSLIDNSPTSTLESLAKFDTRVTYLHQLRNRGYGAGHNVAISTSVEWATYHVVMNPDIWFGPKLLPSLVSKMNRYTDIGLAMPKIIYPDQTLQRCFKLLPTPQVLLLRRFPFFRRMTDQANEEYELQAADPHADQDVPFVSGCFMFLRMSALKEIGPFDERYFMYLEDTDLSRRFASKSRVRYFADVEVVHEHQKGSFKFSKLFLIHLQSAFRYFNKWGWFFDRERDRLNRETIRNCVKR